MMRHVGAKAAHMRRRWVRAATQKASTQGIAGGGSGRQAVIVGLLLTSLVAVMSTMAVLMPSARAAPYAPLCILISHTLTYTVMQGRSAVMGVKIIYKKAIKMIITVVKIS